MTKSAEASNNLNAAAIELTTERFFMRPIGIADVTEHYLNWFKTPASDHISSSGSMRTIDDLKAYVTTHTARDDVIFLGIFDRHSKQHIGNLKYDPVKVKTGQAVLGIFIGEAEWQGKGVAGEVIAASAKWLHHHRHIREIVLGVDRENTSAISAYGKIGFITRKSSLIPSGATIQPMVWIIE